VQPEFVSPWDNTNIVLTLPNSSILLAQCTRLEASELFGIVARFYVSDFPTSCYEL